MVWGLLLLLFLSGCGIVESTAVLPSFRVSYGVADSTKTVDTLSAVEEPSRSADLQPSTSTSPRYVSAQEASMLPKVVRASKAYLGVPYRFGGTTRSGLDCSGFIWKVQRDMGNSSASRASSSDIYLQGITISRRNLQEGDLCFFGPSGRRVNHVGIYVGNNEFIHASSSRGVMISSLNDSYWAPRIVGFKRINW